MPSRYSAPGEMPTPSTNRYLAYEHSISIDTEEKKIATLFENAQATCRTAVAESCAILAAQISNGRLPSASLKFRAKPEGIKKLIASLSSQGKVTDQSTTAEDLAAPIEDSGKKLAMLEDYRAKLEALRNRSNNDVDALIKLNHELAQVQSDIEAMTGKKAHLKERVETEILHVSISATHSRSFWSPVSQAVSDFGQNFSNGISTAVTGTAYLLPWLVILFFLVWGVRKFWNRKKKMHPNN